MRRFCKTHRPCLSEDSPQLLVVGVELNTKISERSVVSGYKAVAPISTLLNGEHPSNVDLLPAVFPGLGGISGLPYRMGMCHLRVVAATTTAASPTSCGFHLIPEQGRRQLPHSVAQVVDMVAQESFIHVRVNHKV